MAARFWTCQRRTKGVVCKHVNPKRLQICARCGKRRPKTKKPTHMAILDEMSYEDFVEIYGEKCGICGVTPKPGKKLHRDHLHRDFGTIRGLLCWPCNSRLSNRIDLVWLRSAVDYLERAERAS